MARNFENMVSAIHVVTVNLCHCVHGTCSQTSWFTPSPRIPSYRVQDCDCEDGRDGDYCGEDRDGCVASPCGTGQCEDLSPEDEVAEGRPYNCTSCSEGYEVDSLECVGQ